MSNSKTQNNVFESLDVESNVKDEWARVSSNPDNFIVSDVLRSALPDEMIEEESISTVLEVGIDFNGLEINAPLTRLDMNTMSWTCQVSADSSDAAVILSYSLEEMFKARLHVKDKGNTLMTLSCRKNDDLTFSIDSDGRFYYVTFTCVTKTENENET